MLIPRFIVSIFSVGLISLSAGGVSGQDYPTKLIRIVTSEPGGGADFSARLIAQGLTGALGQPVIVENRGGGVIPGEIVSKAPPDGYTLVVYGPPLWIGPLIQKTPYDPVRDFSPISMLANAPNILVVHPSLPVKSAEELIALAKARPGQLNYASGPVASSIHLAGALFKTMARINVVDVPYKGGAAGINAVIGGQVPFTFASAASVAPYIKAGKLVALAVTSAKPSTLAPGLPVLAATLPGYEAGGQSAIFAPAKTPAAIIKRLNQELVRLINQPDMKQKYLSVGFETVGSSPEEFANFIKSDMARLGKLFKDIGIKVE